MPLHIMSFATREWTAGDLNKTRQHGNNARNIIDLLVWSAVYPKHYIQAMFLITVRTAAGSL